MERRDYPLMRERLDDLRNRLVVARFDAQEAVGSQYAPDSADKIIFGRLEAERLRREIGEIEDLLDMAEKAPAQMSITLTAATFGALGIVLLVVLTTLIVNSVVR